MTRKKLRIGRPVDASALLYQFEIIDKKYPGKMI